MPLRIVSVNDVYSLENLPRLKTLVASLRPDAVVLAGDFLAPSLLSSIDAGRGMVDCLNAVGVTHVILGNHEDDLPGEELRLRLGELRAVCIGTNVREGMTLPKHAILEKDGVRFGMVGVVLNDPAAYRGVPFGGCVLGPANDAAIAEAQRLLDGGCDRVIAMTHQAFADDEALAHGPVKFAVIIGGHEHVPIVVEKNATWIVKTGSEAVNAAIIEIGDATTVRLEPVAHYAEDAALRALVDQHMSAVHELASATLVELKEPLSSVGSRSRQTTFGAFLAARLRDAFGADLGLFNGGGIRGSREYLEVLTYGDIETEVPFDNEIVVANVPGSVVIEAVAASRAKGESGAYLQVDDRFGAVDPARIYKVATVRQLFLGMDRIEPLVRWAEESPSELPPAGSGREPKLLLVQCFAREIWKTLGGFDQVDQNHDDQVTPSELAYALEVKRGVKPSPMLADIVFRAIDANGDRVITRDEA